jgi:intracellular septation protein
MNKIFKFALEIGPLLVFFFLNNQQKTINFMDYDLKPLMMATAGFIVATLISLIVTYILMRKLPIMPLVSGVFVVLLGGLTLYLNDETFIKIKPTVVNILFGSILLIGLKFDRVFLKLLLEDGIQLNAVGWRGLTIRWGLFFYFLAITNEIVWRSFTTDQWATFKVFGTMPITIIFILSQVKFMMKHIISDNPSETLPIKDTPVHKKSYDIH